ncbi:MAG: DUF4031 domain-containing protein [Propioniciclava sp.]|uniref:DUF4031 domain-containing protein n=1 Tax=Propioniciclava sp. TaxID=2038686 RepID=UPI0039E49E08
MILLDAPRWPAHGTLWGHLVSDASLAELHTFARAAGLPARSFDHDHYDYPLARHDELVALGAALVPSTELLRRLRTAGLRVRPAQKTPSRAEASDRLRRAWSGLLPAERGLRDDLLARWSEPHRRYHDLRHLASCLMALAALDVDDDPVVQLAAWFHDAVYTGRAGEDEEASAVLAEQRLDGLLPDADVAEVARLVRLTATHDPAPGDARGAALVDADLSILGALPGRYHVYARDVRLEYDHLDADTFAAGRAAVLRTLLARRPLFRTPAGIQLWERPARTNMREELAELTG